MNERPDRKKIVGQIGMVLLVLVLLFVAFLAYGNTNNRWYRVLVVYSDSMSPTFNAGDLIIIVRPPPVEKLEPGMIITFQTYDLSIVTHRIVEVRDGPCIVTKGDANENVDLWSDGDGEYQIHSAVGLYIGHIPYLGWFYYPQGLTIFQ